MDFPPKDRSATRLPIVDGGPLIIPVEVKDIVGAAVREDHGAVALKLETTDGNRALLGMTPGVVDAMIETLQKIRAEMTAHGIEQTIPFSPIHTSQVGVQSVESVPFVAMIFDRSLQSAKAFLLPPKAARALARQLISVAQMASSARGEPIEVDRPGRADREVDCPGHVASSDNPKVCGRCGCDIDSLRPEEN